MDSPLNLAHQQARKADSMVKAGKFEEAINCHNRAAEYLLDAMQQTRYKPALESLRLQHAHHLKQTDKLYDRQRRAQLLQIKQNRQQQVHQAVQTTLQGPVVSVSSEHSSQTTGDISHNIHDPNMYMHNTSPLEDDNIYRTLTEQDSLIGILLRRRQNQDEMNLTSLHSGIPVERVFFSKPADIGKSRDSPDKEMDDLRCHNEDLRKHVTQLLDEVDKLKKENKKLKDKGEEGEGMFTEVGSFDLDTIPELPPLEMPTFDFNLLTSDECDKESSFEASGPGKTSM